MISGIYEFVHNELNSPAAPAEAEAASWFISCASAKPIARNEGGDRGAYSPPYDPLIRRGFSTKIIYLEKNYLQYFSTLKLNFPSAGIAVNSHLG